MTIITCIDKDGIENNFKYSLEVVEDENYKKWNFMVIPANEIFKDFFFFSAQETKEKQVKITMMNNHNQKEYSAKGIPEKLIQTISLITNQPILSSSNISKYKSFEEEYRTPQATKVWERLKKEGKAHYNEQTDTYRLV